MHEHTKTAENDFVVGALWREPINTHSVSACYCVCTGGLCRC